MAVKIRMKRLGRKNRPEFRIVVADARCPRDGAIIENLGIYHPLEKEQEKVVRFDADRLKYWLSVGAQPSETIVSIMKKHGIQVPWLERAKEKRVKDAAARRQKKGKPPRSELAAKPRAPKKPKEEGAPAEGASIAEKAKAAATKAAKREAKKAK